MPHYSPEREETILQKMAPPQSFTVAELSSQECVSTATLYNWRTVARKRGAVLRSNSAIPDKWSSEEEFRIALETAPFVIVVRSEMDRLLFTPVQPQTGI